MKKSWTFVTSLMAVCVTKQRGKETYMAIDEVILEPEDVEKAPAIRGTPSNS